MEKCAASVCRNRQFLENSAHTNPETPGSRERSELPCGHGISRNYPLGRRQWCHVGRRRHVAVRCLPSGDRQLSPSPGRQTSASDDVILLFLIPAVRQGNKYIVFVCVPFFLHSLQSQSCAVAEGTCMTTMASKDGYSWTKADGLRAGIPCLGAIQPASNITDTDIEYDVVVVGAGYSGLTAARDTSVAGTSTLPESAVYSPTNSQTPRPQGASPRGPGPHRRPLVVLQHRGIPV